MRPDEAEELLCRRVLIKEPGTEKLSETHIWELSTNKKYVKLGSPSLKDRFDAWMSVDQLLVVDLLGENYFTERQIAKRKRELDDQRLKQRNDITDFIFRV